MKRLLLSVIVIALAACSQKVKDDPKPNRPAMTQAQAAEAIKPLLQTIAAAVDRGNGSDAADFTVGPVYFDYDRADVKKAFADDLGFAAEMMRAVGVKKVRIIGHADERGTREYNDSLAQQRAESVGGILRKSGARIELESRGENEPFCLGHDETCWRLNRRVEIETR